MIPTDYKSALPKSLSYPLGAKAISEAMADAPHVKDFTLSFYSTAIHPAAEFRRVVRESLPYRILEVEYKPERGIGYVAPQWAIERGDYGPKWHLWVFAVLRERRHAAGELLRERGLPTIVEWLRESGQTGWLAHKHKIALVFDPLEGSLAVDREDGA